MGADAKVAQGCAARHTQGPFIVATEGSALVIFDINEHGWPCREIARLACCGDVPLEEQRANANVMAAASMTLVALQALIPMFESWHTDFPRDVGDKEAPALAAARAAIAKALGGAA